jgi:hypothetical protein
MKTREERREELNQLATMPNGTNKLYLILTQTFIPFEKLPIGTLMIEAILDHEYPERKERHRAVLSRTTVEFFSPSIKYRPTSKAAGVKRWLQDRRLDPLVFTEATAATNGKT